MWGFLCESYRQSVLKILSGSGQLTSAGHHPVNAYGGSVVGVSVAFLRLSHARHHGLSGLIMADDDER